MNYIDLIIVILLVIAAVRGAIKGFIVEIASLIALFLGVWGAIKFSGLTETFIVERLNWNSEYIDVIAFAATLVIIVIIVHLIAKAIEKLVESISLGVFNRLFGLVFGVLKSAFFISILIMVVEITSEKFNILSQEKKEESRFYEPMYNFSIKVFPVFLDVFDNVKEKFNDGEEEETDDETDDKQLF